MQKIPGQQDEQTGLLHELRLDPCSGLPPVGVGGNRRPERPSTAPIERRALTREEAAASLGISVDSFERYVQPSIRMLRAGRMRLVAPAELDKWMEDHAAEVLR